MPSFYLRFLMVLGLIAWGSVVSMPLAYAQSELKGSDPYRSTTFPLPRFASISQGKAYVRTGPGKKYPIKWIIEKPGMPVEIILEFDAWRKIRDQEGQEGWVFKSLLSGERTGYITGDSAVTLMKSKDFHTNPHPLAKLEPQLLIQISRCQNDVCEVTAQGFKGWLERKSIWGVYADENFD